MSDVIHYGKLMHKALRTLMRDVLTDVAESGLPGEHHFFITFETTHAGVDISDHLRERYPEEMTIVIQEWFDNLAVMPDRFTITLNFGDVPEPLVIPFDAIKTFVDPSVEFGLRFDASEEADDAPTEEDLPSDPPAPPTGDAEVVSLDTFRKS